LARAGKLTPSEADAITKKWHQNYLDGVEIEKRLNQASKKHRTEEALMLNDSLLQKWPFNTEFAAGKKYALLTNIDSSAAKAYGEELLRDQYNAPLVLKVVAAAIMEGHDIRDWTDLRAKISGTPDYQLAKRLLLQSLTCSERDEKTDKYLKKIEKKESK
jgi:hypothetical protein